MVQEVQQWLFHTEEAENWKVAQSTGSMSQHFQSGAEGLHSYWSSAGLLYWKPEKAGSNICKRMLQQQDG